VNALPLFSRTAAVDRRAGRAWAFVCAIVVVAVAGPSLAAPSMAVFPTGGSASAEQRSALDTALRKAVAGDGGYVLLSAAETAENVEFMAEGGALCTPSDVGCLQKFGLVATVDLLLVADARGRKTLDVTLRLVDVGSGELVRAVDGALQPRDGAAVAALVHRALQGDSNGDGEGGRARTDDGPRVDSEDRTPANPRAPAVDETELSGRRLAGAWAAGVGGGIGALALLGALGGEAVFWTGTGSKQTRQDVVAPFAQAMWLVTLAGAAAAGVGAALFLIEEAPASPTVDG
jgi:hypothetical protein